MLEQYDETFPDLKPTLEIFGREMAEEIADFATVDFPGVVCSRRQIEATIACFESNRVDLLMVVMLSYAGSHAALPALCNTKLPILVFSTQSVSTVTQATTYDDVVNNHGLAGISELTNSLLRVGRRFFMVTGHYKDRATLKTLRRYCDAARAVTFMRQARVGVLGYRSETMGDTAFDATLLLSQMGVEIQHIQMQAVAERALDAPTGEIEFQMAADRAAFELDPSLSTESHEAAARLEWALRSICREYRLDGVAPNFGAILADGRIRGLPFLASCKLMADGIAFSGEGDVVGAVTVAMMIQLAGEATFTEWFTIDFERDAVWMSHMSEGNWKLARPDELIRLVAVDAPKTDPRTVSVTFALKPGEVTIANLATSAGGQLKLVCGEGEIVDFGALRSFPSPSAMFRPGAPVCEFLTQYSLAGGGHHLALAYGRYAKTLEILASMLGIAFQRVKES
jgi:L-arabinose isomerase